MDRTPVLLAPMAAILGDRIGRMSISTQTMRSVLDSILMRLDEDRDTSRYLTGLLIFLGLLGTFWGLLADGRRRCRCDRLASMSAPATAPSSSRI